MELRNRTYRHFAESGHAPTASELGLSAVELGAGWRRLHDAHALVLSPATGELRMLNPFSLVPTAHRVVAGGRRWYANCAWDAVGVCAALHVDGRVETSCPDCGEAIVLDDRGRAFPTTRACASTASSRPLRWWDDIVFT